MTDRAERARPAQQLAAARERIVAEMDRLQQKIANLDALITHGQTELSALRADRVAALAEEAGLRTALAALPPMGNGRTRRSTAAPAKPGRRMRAATPAPAGVAGMPTNGEADRAE